MCSFCDNFWEPRQIAKKEMKNFIICYEYIMLQTFMWKSYMRVLLSCACFGPRHSPFSYYYCRASDIPAVGTSFNVLAFYKHNLILYEMHIIIDIIFRSGRFNHPACLPPEVLYLDFFYLFLPIVGGGGEIALNLRSHIPSWY